MMTQYKMIKALKTFGDCGAAAIEKQIRQLLNMDTIEKNNPKDMPK